MSADLAVKLQLYGNIYLLLMSGFGMFLGLFAVFARKRKAIYLYFTVLALISSFLSCLFYTLMIAFYGGLPDIFNIGFLGYAATFLFFFFANYGQMDLLIDDRRSIRPIYRIVPLVIPVVELTAALLGMIYGVVSFSVRVCYLVISLISALAGYYHLKHLIIPDLDDGFAKALRSYNAIAMLIGFFSLTEIGLSVFGHNTVIIFAQFFLGLLYAAVFPVLDKGVKKWIR